MILKGRQNLGKMIADGQTVCADDLIKFMLWNYTCRYTGDRKKALKRIQTDLTRIAKG